MQVLNRHYQLRHKPQMCGICKKLFDLTGSLKKHMYSHLDKPHKCDKYSELFHFESELTNHKVVHHTMRMHFLHGAKLWKKFYAEGGPFHRHRGP